MQIECCDLVKKYIIDGDEVGAVDHASLSINRGEFAIILGHSGSGKTTLLSMIGGLAKPDQGSVTINGIDCWKQSEIDLALMRNRTIGFIFQFGSLIPTLTTLENVLLPLSFSPGKKSMPEDIAHAHALLEQVGLADKKTSFPAQLSGGQQRRVAIARAFITRPEIILADEPTGDLDEETENDILRIFRKYNTEQNTTFLVVTHNSHLCATQHQPRTFMMQKGSISEITPDGTADEDA
ncbi:MAG: ABC transporter ATP-binding protein [Proteobacteria bacterium]|nr:ABC transporter ATP-binding protein [Pseudomonadota bacterium]MBU1739368.1 ABC transporter ATP-binding protein [Pseudomonadota bacterium]